METREILTRFKNGELSMEETEHYFRKEPFEEMDDYAKLDSHREIRSGFPEVIFCSGKADQHFVHIFKKLYFVRISWNKKLYNFKAIKLCFGKTSTHNRINIFAVNSRIYKPRKY